MARKSSHGKKAWIFLIALGVVAVLVYRNRGQLAAAGPKASGTPIARQGLTPYGAPRGHELEGTLLARSAYECRHDRRLKVSRWVAYRAEGDDTTGAGRYSGGFYADPDLVVGQRAEPADYQGAWKKDKTGFDRGHQAPDATLKRFGRDAQRESYSLANITPQYSRVNQGVWQDLEAEIRRWSSSSRPVWVCTGPVFFARRDTLRIGRSRVAVPHAYYAVLSREPGPEVLAFLVMNEPDLWNVALDRFVVSVDSVEKLSRLDFLWELPDSVENVREKAAARKLWQPVVRAE